MENDNSLQIVVQLQDDASAGLADLVSTVSDATAGMSEAFASASTASQESFDELASACAIDSADITDEMIAVGTSFDDAAAMIATASSGASESMDSMNSATASSTNSMRSGFIQLGIAAGIPFAALSAGMKTATDAADAWNQESAVVQKILQDTGESIPLAQIQEFARNMQETTLFTQQDALQASGLVLSHKELSGSYQELISLSADAATKMGSDLPTATRLLTNAMSDPVAGINQLIRTLGTDFSAAQVTAIETMAKTGDTAGADAIILSTLNTQIGGVAQASYNASDGLDKQNQQMGLLSQDVGQALLPALNQLAADLIPIIQSIDTWTKAHPELTKVILLGTAAVLGFLTLIGAVGIYAMAWSAGMTLISGGFVAAVAAMSAPIAPLLIALAAVATAIVLITNSYANMKAAQEAAAAAQQNSITIGEDALKKAEAMPDGPLKQQFIATDNSVISGAKSALAGGSNTAFTPGGTNNSAPSLASAMGSPMTFNFSGMILSDPSSIKNAVQQYIVPVISRGSALKTQGGL